MHKLNDLLAKIGGSLQSLALLVVRLGWGYDLFVTGRAHLGDVATMVKRFQGWHVPFPAASVYVSGGTELVGGLLLMLGLFSRPIALVLFFNFCVAFLTAGRDDVGALIHLHNPENFVEDAAFPFLAASLLVFAFGPGRVSLDALFFKSDKSD